MSVLGGVAGMGAEPSRQLQDHCQGKHQGEPDAGRARSGTWVGRHGGGSGSGSGPPTRVGVAGCGSQNGRASKGPHGVWIQQQDVLGSNPSSATCRTKMGVTPSLSRGCWAEPGGHGIIQWGPGAGTSMVKCAVGSV